MAWVQIVIALVMMIVGELLRPKPKLQDAKPSALGEFNFPTADASRVIPFFVGTCKFAGMNCAWYGNLVIKALTKRVKTGLFSSQRITTGYNYSLGVQMIAGYGPADELVGFVVDDKPVQIRNLVDHGDYWAFTLDEPTLMDADDPPSGIKGKVRIYKGTQTQPADPYLAAQWGEAAIPAFRPLCYMVLEAFYIGNSETPPVFAPILRRCPNTLGLTGGKHVVNGDANIACVAYLMMTDMLYGLKIAGTAINTASFIDCGNVLHSENLGISMQFDVARPGKDWLGEVLRYADAVVYPDPVTGLYTMKMARFDYNPDTLDVYDDDDIEEEGFEFSRTSWEETKNTIIINYTDRAADFNVRPVQYQDLANIFSRGNVVDPETIEFLGISNPTSATVIATRVGKTLASPLARCAMKMKRRGYALRPGSVFRMSKPNRGVESLIVRVGDISYGTLDDPRVSVTVTEDVFAVKAISYVPPTPTVWTPPSNQPMPVHAQTIMELPKMTSPADTRYVGVLAANAGAQETAMELWTATTVNGTYSKAASSEDFTPTGLLLNSYPVNGPSVDDVGFIVTAGRRMDELTTITTGQRNEGHNLCLINSEIIAWREVVNNNDGTYTIRGNYRGSLDTVPATHAVGARVWFFTDGVALVADTGWGADITTHVKVLPKVGASVGLMLALNLATPLSITTNARAARPLPPGNFRINGTRALDVTGGITGPFSVTWGHRNRNDTLLAAQTDASRTAEEGTTYSLRVYNDTTNGLLASDSGKSGLSASVQAVGATRLRLELWATRDTLDSWQKQVVAFDYSATGSTTNKVTIDNPQFVLDGGGA